MNIIFWGLIRRPFGEVESLLEDGLFSGSEIADAGLQHISRVELRPHGAFTGRVEAEIVARFRRVADVTSDLPVTAEQLFLFQFKQLVAGVGPCWKT